MLLKLIFFLINLHFTLSTNPTLHRLKFRDFGGRVLVFVDSEIAYLDDYAGDIVQYLLVIRGLQPPFP